MATDDVPRRHDRPGRQRNRVRTAAIGIVLAGYAWAAGSRPSSCTTADTTTTGPCITVCYGTSCSGDTNSISTTIRGTSVTVTAASSIDLILPRLLGISTFNINGTTTMLVNS